MHTGDGAAPYTLGHSEQELARLERQGEMFAAETREVLTRAGLAPGMHVLDIGCGVGDVSLIAADLVGPGGSVLGIDRAADALPVARARAARLGFDQVRFHDADLFAFEPDRRYDALIGRFILMHVRDPVGAIRRLCGHLGPGAAVAFVELDIESATAVPEIPLLRSCIDWIVTTYRRAGAQPNMGSRLYATFRAAGLTPSLTGMTRIVNADDRAVFAFAAATLSSLLPRIEEYRVATAAEIDVGTIAERLHATAVAGDHCLMMPRVVGAWARVSGV